MYEALRKTSPCENEIDKDVYFVMMVRFTFGPIEQKKMSSKFPQLCPSINYRRKSVIF